MTEDMSEFEAEVADVVDPSPFTVLEPEHEAGKEIAQLLSRLTNLLCDDLVRAMNKGLPAFCQYLWPDGTSMTTALATPKRLQIVVDHAGDHRWITIGGAD